MTPLHDCPAAPLLCTCPRPLCVAARRQAALHRASVALARAQDCRDGYIMGGLVEDAFLALIEAGEPDLAHRVEDDGNFRAWFSDLGAVERAIDRLLAAANEP